MRLASCAGLGIGIGIGIALTALAAPPGWAAATSARALGMGNAYSVVAEEADMASWNPALLGLKRRSIPAFALQLPSANAGVGNNFLSLDAINGLLPDDSGNSRVMNDQAMQALLNSLGDKGWELLALDAGSRMFAVAIPPLRTSLSAQADIDIQGVGLPKGIMELLLQGNTTARNINLDGLKGASATALVSAGVSHGIPVDMFSGRNSAVGITVRYLQGFGWLNVVDASGSVMTVDEQGRVSADAGARYLMTFAQGDSVLNTGTGIAADLGFVTQWDEAITWGLTIGNLGFVKWNKLQDKTFTIKYGPTNLGLGYTANPDGTEATQGSPKDPFKDSTRNGTGPSDGQSNVDGRYPPYLRLGMSWRGALSLPRISQSPLYWNTPPVPVLFSADIQQGFGTGYGISLVPEVHVGMETRPLTEIVPLRLGVSLGARTMVSLGTGVDLGFFKVDTALGMMNGVFGGSKGIYGALTSQLEF